MGIWVEQQFRAMGLETHIDGFAATVNGKDVALQNVWAVSKGRTQGTIMVLANRDVPPLATQGAGDNASGVAAMLGLARRSPSRPTSTRSSSSAPPATAFGALGARRASPRSTRRTTSTRSSPSRDVAKRDSDGIGLDGWSSEPKTAPPWLWLLSAPAAKRDSNLDAELPTVAAQVLRLAVPTSAGSQGPFVASGVPAITVSAAGPSAPARNDTLDTVSKETLTKVGTAAQNMVMAVDGTTAARRAERRRDLPDAQGDAAGRRARRHPRRPAPAARRRNRRPLRPLSGAAASACAPPSCAPASTSPRGSSSSPSSYFANLVGLLPHSPDAVDPSGLAARGHAALPARDRPHRPHAARLRLRRRRRTAPGSDASPRTPAPRSSSRTCSSWRSRCCCCSSTRSRSCWCCRAPSCGRSHGRADGPARSSRSTSGCSWCRCRSSTTPCSWTWAGRSGGTSSCCSRTGRSRLWRSCWRPLFFSTAGVLAHTLHERGLAPDALLAGGRPARPAADGRRGVGGRRRGRHRGARAAGAAHGGASRRPLKR